VASARRRIVINFLPDEQQFFLDATNTALQCFFSIGSGSHVYGADYAGNSHLVKLFVASADGLHNLIPFALYIGPGSVQSGFQACCAKDLFAFCNIGSQARASANRYEAKIADHFHKNTSWPVDISLQVLSGFVLYSQEEFSWHGHSQLRTCNYPVDGQLPDWAGKSKRK